MFGRGRCGDENGARARLGGGSRSGCLARGKDGANLREAVTALPASGMDCRGAGFARFAPRIGAALANSNGLFP